MRQPKRDDPQVHIRDNLSDKDKGCLNVWGKKLKLEWGKDNDILQTLTFGA